MTALDSDASHQSTSDIDELRRLTSLVLSHDGPRGILVGIVMEIVEILERTAAFQIDPEADVADGETYSAEGLAISPTQAAMCADQSRRTAMFLRGVHDAISKALAASTSSKPVHVLYAGSGPYATLAVPLMTLFSPEEVRFTILDLHKISIQSVKSIVRRLRLGGSVVSYVVADACHYKIPEDEMPDVILSETMNAALEFEPQVAIMRRLFGQAPGALIVPQSVQVDAFLVDTSKEITFVRPETEDGPPDSHPDRIPVGPVFSLDAAAIASWAALGDERLPAAAVRLPPAPNPSYKPYLFTTIVTHGDHILRTHDSGLTSPRAFPEKGPLSSGQVIQFRYRLGASPALTY
jgi:hypothetical protein